MCEMNDKEINKVNINYHIDERDVQEHASGECEHPSVRLCVFPQEYTDQQSHKTHTGGQEVVEHRPLDPHPGVQQHCEIT